MPERPPDHAAGMPHPKTRFACAAALVLGLAVSLAPSVVYAQSPRQSYQVEVLVFGQPTGASLEKAPRPRPGVLELAPGETLGDAREEDADSIGLPAGFAPPTLPRALDAIAARLARAGHPVIWHQAWIQPAATRDSPALPVLAALGQGRADPGLRGTVTVSAGRFLHLELALELESSAGLEAKLEQRRRIRLGAEQYFDHPRIGVIAVVTRATADDSQAPGAPGL